MIRKITFLLLFSCLSIPVFSQSNLKTENVILITLDGFRWQELYTGIDAGLMNNEEYVENQDHLKELYWAENPELRREKLMPFFWTTIAREGQLYGNRNAGNHVNVTNGLFFSYPGYNEILTGYADEKVDSNDKIWNPNKTVLEFVNEQPEFAGKVAAFASWDVFPFIINSQRSGIPVNAGFEPVEGTELTDRERFLNELISEIPSPWGTVRLDAFTHHYALEHLKTDKPRLLYVAYGETDDFAHDGDYEAYIKSANQTDRFIRQLWEFVQEEEQYRGKTTFIITTDHGRGTEPTDQWRHHGADVDGADEIWIAAIGPDTPALGELGESGQLYQNQIAKTVAELLGLNYQNKVVVGDAINTIIQNSN
ncbi:alkaline phosphatase family protein [Rhodohalobacter sp. 614A]|uniref:alkaline phosphatase family protein n=1 Tax=Rhodohalobacter sp. 614A TaxID=2908649 RepID=UPI001F16FBE8|nr:alkaline phosphatase family protein [Rhodohalobacter sp. 614A]